jgi:phytoene dehydrogenase-like protein
VQPPPAARTAADAEGRYSAALFVQWVPYELAGTSWEAEEGRYVQHLLGLLDRFAPGASSLVVDSFTLTPPVIERYFGITRGHIHHIDNSFGFADRFPYRTPLEVGPCRLPGRPRGTRYACWALQRASRVAHMNAGLVKWVPCPQPSHA